MKIFVNKLFFIWKAHTAKRVANRQFKKISRGLKIKRLSNEQKKEIRAYFREKFGIKVSTKWHELAYTISGIYDKRLLPNDFYIGYVQPALVDYRIKIAYDDKNFYSRLFPWANLPQKKIQCCNGLYYCERMQKWGNRNEFIHEYQDIDRAIIKPTLFSNSGRSICFLSVKNGKTNIDDVSVEQIMDRYEPNFLIEEVVKQHHDMERLNPSSLNTLRVISYRIDDNVFICQIICRIGMPGSVCDNFSQGGIACHVNSDGTLSRYAYTKYLSQPQEYTSSGIKLDGYLIPGFCEVKDFVKRAHLSLPQFPLLAWDIAIGEDSKPVLIEFNIHFGNTIALELGLPLLGDYTDQLLPIIRNEYEKRLCKSIHICLG